MTARRNPLFSLRVVLAGIALCALSLVATPAFSQMVCGDHDSVDKRLRDGYSEAPAGAGLAHNGAVVTLYVSETGTFTIVLTVPNGKSCLVVVGESFEWLKSVKQARGISSPMYPDERNWPPTQF